MRMTRTNAVEHRLRESGARLAIALLLPLFLLSATFASADGLTLEKFVRNLDPSIQSVLTCGDWQHGNESGVFRVISGWLYGHGELYVQWVADPIWSPKKGQQQHTEARVMETAIFPDLDNYEAATDLDNVRCVHTRYGWAVTADADNAHDEGPTAKYRLLVYLYDEPGKFRFVARPHRASRH